MTRGIAFGASSWRNSDARREATAGEILTKREVARRARRARRQAAHLRGPTLEVAAAVQSSARLKTYTFS
jgi:hypothetical protein